MRCLDPVAEIPAFLCADRRHFYAKPWISGWERQVSTYPRRRDALAALARALRSDFLYRPRAAKLLRQTTTYNWKI